MSCLGWRPKSLEKYAFNLLTQPGGVDHQFGKPAPRQRLGMPADQRLAAHLQQGLGHGVGQRAHALAAAGGHDHGFDGCRGHGGSLTGGAHAECD
jgi:hypothetical protein